MPLGILDILGAIGNAGADQAIRNQAITSARQKREEAERKRQEQEQQRLLTGLSADVREAVILRNSENDFGIDQNIQDVIREKQAKQQQEDLATQEQSATDAFIEGTQGRSFAPITTTLGEREFTEPGRPVTEGEATALATAGRQGQGLNVLTSLNKDRRDLAKANAKIEEKTILAGLSKERRTEETNMRAKINQIKTPEDQKTAAGQARMAGFEKLAQDILALDIEKANRNKTFGEAFELLKDDIREGATPRSVRAQLKNLMDRPMTESEQNVVLPLMEEGLFKGVQMTAAQVDDIARASIIVKSVARLEKMLQDPAVQKSVGTIDHLSTSLEKWLRGGVNNSGTQADDNVQRFLSQLGFAVDDIQRLQSGAALTEDEKIFYQGLLGSISDSEEALRVKFATARDQFLERVRSTYRVIFAPKFALSPESFNAAVSVGVNSNFPDGVAGTSVTGINNGPRTEKARRELFFGQ